MKLIPPVIKWSGSKRSIASKIAQVLPATGRYYEPFLGGGAILGTQPGRPSRAGDVVTELVGIWSAVQCDPDRTVAEYSERWNLLQNEGHPAFYQIRNSFNATRNPHDLLFLSRTCVNGLIRFNRSGDFNNSLHHTRKGILPARFEGVVRQWNSTIRNTVFLTGDFEECLSSAKSGDVAFLDPPYVGTRGRYHPGLFDFDRLWTELDRLNAVGVKWVLTLDGSAGARDYGHSWVPEDLYQERLTVGTGSSPFVRVMEGRVDEVRESVFLNFEPTYATSQADNLGDGRLESRTSSNVEQRALFIGEELDPDRDIELASVERVSQLG
jgi:DNA adenine methylase